MLLNNSLVNFFLILKLYFSSIILFSIYLKTFCIVKTFFFILQATSYLPFHYSENLWCQSKFIFILLLLLLVGNWSIDFFHAQPKSIMRFRAWYYSTNCILYPHPVLFFLYDILYYLVHISVRLHFVSLC